MQVRTDLFERDVPPGPVSSFKVSDTEGVHTDGRRIWTLTWFNGGDHGYDGTATSFELRYSTDRDKLRRNFSSCDIVDPASDLAHGSLVPQPAYTAQAVEFIVPLSLTQELQRSGAKFLVVFFDIKPVSSTGIIGEGLPISVQKFLCPGTKPCGPSQGDSDDDTTVEATTENPETTVPTGTDLTTTNSTTTKVTAESTATTEYTGEVSTHPVPPTTITADESGNLPPTTTASPRPDKESEGLGSGDASTGGPAEEMGGSASNFTHVVALFSSVIVAMGICLGLAIYLATRKQESADVLVPPSAPTASNW
ncbi:uncharacterized protein LOC144098036 [Amblyomma americanum]